MEYMLVLRLGVCMCTCELALEQTSSSPSAPRVVACPPVYPASSTSRGGTDGGSGNGGGSGVVVVVVAMVVVLVFAPPVRKLPRKLRHKHGSAWESFSA
ncbi:hypothetical protein HZH66_003903 [Vespula vulgaris]|uniref:Uncharacterized protein n=1 Tax=Vespula vulgaris TaxID=7454 RepID=A0A834KFJ7_VESVU|nr:hypothetical protein HZH66_003903 [Vespula vulgaris]